MTYKRYIWQSFSFKTKFGWWNFLSWMRSDKKEKYVISNLTNTIIIMPTSYYEVRNIIWTWYIHSNIRFLQRLWHWTPWKWLSKLILEQEICNNVYFDRQWSCIHMLFYILHARSNCRTYKLQFAHLLWCNFRHL